MAILRSVRAVFRKTSKRRSVVFERAAKFNTRVQKEAESVDDFITDVYRLYTWLKIGKNKVELLFLVTSNKGN